MDVSILVMLSFGSIGVIFFYLHVILIYRHGERMIRRSILSIVSIKVFGI